VTLPQLLPRGLSGRPEPELCGRRSGADQRSRYQPLSVSGGGELPSPVRCTDRVPVGNDEDARARVIGLPPARLCQGQLMVVTGAGLPADLPAPPPARPHLLVRRVSF